VKLASSIDEAIAECKLSRAPAAKR
jgi:hypothetical protein